MTDIGDLTGKQLGHFKILRKLGAGGMAVVYKAHEMSLNRTVALKVIGSHLMEDPSFVERFQREAQAAARINHPNIVQIYSIGDDDGLHYFAMEYIDGKSVEEILAEEGFLTVPKALPITRQVAAALAEAHDEDIVHRDIKPANIMIDRAGRVRVADFGIAFMQTEAARLTQDGAWVGTPKYVSPEQCRGEAVDGRSDIYSLGVTLYEMLSGQAPFNAKTPAGLVMQIVKGESEPIRKVNPTVPGEIGDLLDRMIALDPADRFQSAGDLALEIERMEDKGLTTASHEVHPEAVEGGLPPTVAMGREEAASGAESPTEIVGPAEEDATEVLGTEPGESPPAPSGPTAGPGSRDEDAARTPDGKAGEEPQRTRSDAAASSPSPVAESGDGDRPAAAEPQSGAAGPPRPQEPAASRDEGSTWSRMGLVAAAVVILALVGVVFAVQLSGASRSGEPAADEASGPPEESITDAAEIAGSEEPAGADRTAVAESAGDAAQQERPGAARTDSEGPEEARDEVAGSGAASSTREATESSNPPAGGDAAVEGPEEPASARPSDAATDDPSSSATTDPSGSATTGAQVPSDEAGAEAAPAPSLPPAGSVVLTTTAENAYGDFIHSLVEGRLLREDFDVVDAGSFPGERMADLARVLLETTVSITGRERVSAHGVTVDRVTVSLAIRAVSLVDGRTLTTRTDTVTYTSNDAEQRLEAAVSRLMRDTVEEIRERTDG